MSGAEAQAGERTFRRRAGGVLALVPDEKCWASLPLGGVLARPPGMTNH